MVVAPRTARSYRRTARISRPMLFVPCSSQRGRLSESSALSVAPVSCRSTLAGVGTLQRSSGFARISPQASRWQSLRSCTGAREERFSRAWSASARFRQEKTQAGMPELHYEEKTQAGKPELPWRMTRRFLPWTLMSSRGSAGVACLVMPWRVTEPCRMTSMMVPRPASWP